jgi:hypothetical protein
MAVTVLAVLAFLYSNTTLASDLPAGKRVPIIVELFTSEGCSDCPPADALLRKLEAAQPIPNAEIIVLGEHVDYWNHIGWTDRFSSKQFTERQQYYVNDFALDSAYTPQMVVDGRAEFNGANGPKAASAIADAAKQPRIEIALSEAADGHLKIAIPASVLAKKSEVVLAITESNLTSEVKKGENDGRTLTHTGVVRSLKKIGELKGDAFSSDEALNLSPDWKRVDLRAVVFVQEKNSRHIIGAAAVKLQK